jgi:hypothetical protein
MTCGINILFLFALQLEGEENPAPPRPTIERRLDALEERDKELQEQNRDLRQRLESFEGKKAAQPTRPTSDTRPKGGSPPTAPQEGGEEDDSSVEALGSGLGLTAADGRIQALFNLYCDVGFLFSNPPEAQHAHSSFGFGSIDIFGTGQLSERFQVLTETVLEGSDNEIGLDQERLWASWTFNDLLYAKLGLEHLPTSRWNRVYHHGKWLQLTVERPFLARFEDDGGILAKHFVGIEAGGHVNGSLGRLEYLAIVSNGRGKVPEDRQTIFDQNDAKAFDAAIGFVPACLDRLRIGGAFRFDELPGDPAVPARAHSIRELQGNVNLEWKSKPKPAGQLEVLTEWILLSHQDRTAGGTFRHSSFYFQTGYQIAALNLTPYMRFDRKDMQRSDPFYEPEDRDLDQWEQLFGLRYDFTSNAAIKGEVGLGQAERRSQNGDIRQVTTISVRFQLSWVF